MKQATLETVYFTKPGYEHILAEYEKLTVRRPEVLKRLQAAREMGDLSENGAYKAARFELADLDRNLRQLAYLKHVGKVVTPPKDTIGIGSPVSLKGEAGTMRFTLVNKYEADPNQKKLSDESPFGQAVLGKKSGETVTVTTPNGALTYLITL